MAIKFEWHPEKAEANRKKHKVGFEQARDVFKDSMALDELDDREDYGEERSTALAWSKVMVLSAVSLGPISGEEFNKVLARL